MHQHQVERLHLTDVGFQGDSTQETVDAQRIGSQRRCEVAQHDPHCDGNPGRVRVQFVVLHFGQNIDVLVPQRKHSQRPCKFVRVWFSTYSNLKLLCPHIILLA